MQIYTKTQEITRFLAKQRESGLKLGFVPTMVHCMPVIFHLLKRPNGKTIW